MSIAPAYKHMYVCAYMTTYTYVPRMHAYTHQMCFFRS